MSSLQTQYRTRAALNACPGSKPRASQKGWCHKGFPRDVLRQVTVLKLLRQKADAEMVRELQISVEDKGHVPRVCLNWAVACEHNSQFHLRGQCPEQDCPQKPTANSIGFCSICTASTISIDRHSKTEDTSVTIMWVAARLHWRRADLVAITIRHAHISCTGAGGVAIESWGCRSSRADAQPGDGNPKASEPHESAAHSAAEAGEGLGEMFDCACFLEFLGIDL